jgi:regulatory protein
LTDEAFARAILLRRLEDQPRSRAELAASLAKKNVPAEVAVALLDRFEEVGLINDADFARQWVQSRQRTRGLAPRVLAMELRRKGVDDEIISEVLGELDPADARETAHRLVQKKLRSMASLDDTTRIRRLTSMLARKGYAPQLAFDVVRAELEAAAV